MAVPRWVTTQPALLTQPMVTLRLNPTPSAARTRPSGIMRWAATQPEKTTSASATWLVLISQRAVTTLILGMLELPRNPKTIRIGTRGTQKATFIAGIGGATVPTGIAVLVDGNGRLGTITSSARFKDAIKPMDKMSEAILSLKPVTFRYKRDLDPDGIPQFGLVAEEVEEVNPDLVARDELGKPYSVRYDAVNAMLLNEFIKEHRRVQELEATVAQQRKDSEATAV